MSFRREKWNRGAMGRYNRIMMLVMGAAFGFPISASAFTSIPALNFPALQAKRAFTPTLRQFRSQFGDTMEEVQAFAKEADDCSVLAEAAVPEELQKFKLVNILKEAGDLGVVRFLSVTPYGAVLEALGRLDYSYVPFEIPGGKSQANFECSINLDKAATLAFDKLFAPTGELYAMRIMNAEGEKILTILLNYDIEGNGGKPGKYYPGAVEKWEELRKTYADVNGDVKLI